VIFVVQFHVLLTTYEMLMAEDWTELAKINWRAVVVDEAQRLKNTNSRLAVNLRKFKVEFRVLLTGTPIQNNTAELWSLLNYIAPENFASRNDFMAKFGNLQHSHQVEALHKQLKPHLLRRMKEDVEKSIPPKEETIIEVSLSPLQRQYYRAILNRNRAFLTKGCSQKNSPNLMNVMLVRDHSLLILLRFFSLISSFIYYL
jgi:chromodomain-helicase-DNA-binding protein 7